MRVFPASLVLVFAAGCQAPPPAELTAEQETAIAAEIDSLTAAWWEAWGGFDFDRGLSFIQDGENTTWAGAGPTLYSVKEMRETWPGSMAGFSRQEMDFTNGRTIVLAADVVWTLREGNSRLFDTEGNLVSEGQFIETAVWVNRDGEWKVLLGHDDDTTPVS